MVPAEIDEAVGEMEDLLEDESIPKNIKVKISEVIAGLRSSDDISILINRAVHDFEEISEDANLQPYVRTKIWAVVSVLESL